MEFRQLQAFCAIANNSSFTKSAELLGYAQSSITTQIQLLEQEMQTRLFERLGKRVVLTESGKTFLRYAERILALAKEAQEVTASAAAPRGTLTIGAPESLCATQLPLLLREYHKRYPAVKIVLKMGGYRVFQSGMKNNQLDVSFFFQRYIQQHPDFTVLPLAAEPIVAVASPGYRSAGMTKLTLQDLAAETLILGEQGCSYRVILTDLLEQAGIYPETIMELDSVTAITQCAKNGLGIAFLPRFVVERELAAGELIDLQWAGDEFATWIQLAHHKDKWLSPLLTTFIETAKIVFEKHNATSKTGKMI